MAFLGPNEELGFKKKTKSRETRKSRKLTGKFARTRHTSNKPVFKKTPGYSNNYFKKKP